MFNPEEKDTISLRVDYEKQYYHSKANNNNNNSKANNNNNNSRKNNSKVKKLLNPWASYPELWNKIFLASCVFGVSFDPLFLYVPIINNTDKCLTVDEKMKNIALILRTATDFSYVLHIIFRIRKARKIANELNISIFTGLPWTHLLVDILAIVPLPQVIIMKFFAQLAGSRSLTTRKVINILLLLQYIPRLIRVNLSAKELGRDVDSLARRVWVRGAFLFFLYVIFGHIFGSFWYFYAIFRETACWHSACRRLKGCEPSNPFDCRWENPILNTTYLNDVCPVDPPKPTVYDFGIFSDAIESKILQTTDFFKKFSVSFWWGMRNLSSFGQNLDTSSNVIENFFAILISTLGLLLFLYLIGTLQTYMQLATTKSEEARRKLSLKQPEIESFLSNHNLSEHKKKVIMEYLRRTIKDDKDFDLKHLFAIIEEHSEHGQYNSESFAAWVTKILDMKTQDKNTLEMKAEWWVSKNGIDGETKETIMRYVRLRLIEGKDADVANILHILPFEIGKSIKKFLCLPILKKVPMLENIDDYVYETICYYLKPKIFEEKSYIIKKEEPLDFMLFVTQGVVWNFGSSTNLMQRIQKGDFYGNELLEWRLNSISYSEFPISKSNLKCHTKVEAFSLRAVDLEHVLSNCWTKFCNSDSTDNMSEGLKRFAAVSLQQGFRRFIRNKKAKENNNSKLSIVTYK